MNFVINSTARFSPSSMRIPLFVSIYWYSIRYENSLELSINDRHRTLKRKRFMQIALGSVTDLLVRADVFILHSIISTLRGTRFWGAPRGVFIIRPSFYLSGCTSEPPSLVLLRRPSTYLSAPTSSSPSLVHSLSRQAIRTIVASRPKVKTKWNWIHSNPACDRSQDNF